MLRRLLLITLLVASTGCTATRDASPAVADLNALLAREGLDGVAVRCPPAVGRDETPFTCTLSGPGGSADVMLRYVDGSLTVEDQEAFAVALGAVTSPSTIGPQPPGRP